MKRLVFASTGGAICGEVPEGQRADESWRPAPLSPYAIHKLAFEQLLDVYRTHHGLESVVLRYANIYGPRQDPHGEAGVVAIFFDTVLAGKTLRVNGMRTEGDAGCLRDYAYVGDAARANLAALAGRLPERMMNVCTGATVSTLELAREISAVAGAELRTMFAPPRAGRYRALGARSDALHRRAGHAGADQRRLAAHLRMVSFAPVRRWPVALSLLAAACCGAAAPHAAPSYGAKQPRAGARASTRAPLP